MNELEVEELRLEIARQLAIANDREAALAEARR